MKTIKDKFGNTHTIETYGTDKTHATICIDNDRVVNLKMYYRYERTWDDHMGNTECGYYVNIPFYTLGGKRHTKRYYVEFGN